MKIHSNPPSEAGNTRQRVAGILLQYALTAPEARPRLSERTLAAMLGTSWNKVNGSLASLQKEGVIRFERNRMVLNQKGLERIAMKNNNTRAYVLLRTKEGDLAETAAIVRRQPGVVMADRVEGPADVIFAVQASDRESLVTLMVRAIAAVENLTEDIQLLPAIEETAQRLTRQ